MPVCMYMNVIASCHIGANVLIILVEFGKLKKKKKQMSKTKS